jgi:carbamoyl-phosphate synthase large subunit
MGMSSSFGIAFAKAQIAAGNPLPLEGRVFLSVNDFDKANLVPIARGLAGLGFSLCASSGTARYLAEQGLEVEPVFKVGEGRPNIIDRLLNADVQLIINTPRPGVVLDEPALRRFATMKGVPLVTTLSGAAAAVEGIRALREHGLSVMSLQEVHAPVRT